MSRDLFPSRKEKSTVRDFQEEIKTVKGKGGMNGKNSVMNLRMEERVFTTNREVENCQKNK